MVPSRGCLRYRLWSIASRHQVDDDQDGWKVDGQGRPCKEKSFHSEEPSVYHLLPTSTYPRAYHSLRCRGESGTFSTYTSLIQRATFLDSTITHLPLHTVTLYTSSPMNDIHPMKRYAIVGTPTPSDSWSSYFDSWRTEDTHLPAYSEPLIVDDEIHPDLSNLRFNMDMDMEVDWTMDMQSPFVGAAMHSNSNLLNASTKTRLNVAHPDYQRHGLHRHDVDAWQRPWLGEANDDVLDPLHQIQIGAGTGSDKGPRGSSGIGSHSAAYAHHGHHAHPNTQAHPVAHAHTNAHPHPHTGLGVRRAFKVKVSHSVIQSVMSTPSPSPTICIIIPHPWHHRVHLIQWFLGFSVPCRVCPTLSGSRFPTSTSLFLFIPTAQ